MANGRLLQYEDHVKSFTTYGFRPSSPGWEKYSTGFAGNINHRLNTQIGVQNYDAHAVAGREPFRVGRFIVKWLEYPAFFDAEMCRWMQVLLEDNVKGFSGLNDNQISSIDVEDGPVKRPASYAGVYKEGNNSFSLKVPEYRGQPVRKMLDYWLHGISDPKTGSCHFYGKDLAPIQVNKGGTLLYILLGPSLRPDDIEAAAIWYYVTPNSEKFAINNSEMGEEGGNVEHDIEFKGVGFDRTSDEVRYLAQKVVAATGLWGQSKYDEFMPQAYYDKFIKPTAQELSKTFDTTVRGRLEAGFDGEAASAEMAAYKTSLDASSENNTYADQFTARQYNNITADPNMASLGL